MAALVRTGVFVLALVGIIILATSFHEPGRAGGRLTSVAAHGGARRPTTGTAIDFQPDLGFDALNVGGGLARAATAPGGGSTFTISGIVRRNLSDGSIEPRGGLGVRLMRRTVHAQAVRRCLAAEAESWAAYAESATADPTPAEQPAAPDAQDAASTTTDDSDMIAEASATAIARLNSAIQVVPADADAAGVLRTLSDLALFNVPEFDEAANDATVLQTTAGADGRFTLSGIAPGDYYLYARDRRGTTLVEWCVAVHVADHDGAQTINLDDDNTALVRSLE